MSPNLRQDKRRLAVLRIPETAIKRGLSSRVISTAIEALGAAS